MCVFMENRENAENALPEKVNRAYFGLWWGFLFLVIFFSCRAVRDGGGGGGDCNCLQGYYTPQRMQREVGESVAKRTCGAK